MPQYKTKSLYENCHPVIAEHLKRGEAIWCKVWDGGEPIEAMNGYVKKYECDGGSMKYWVNGSWHEHAEPIPQKQKVRRYKKASEIIRWCEENGYRADEDGDWVRHKGDIVFYTDMSPFCGEGLGVSGRAGSFEWHPDWIEEVEE